MQPDLDEHHLKAARGAGIALACIIGISMLFLLVSKVSEWARSDDQPIATSVPCSMGYVPQGEPSMALDDALHQAVADMVKSGKLPDSTHIGNYSFAERVFIDSQPDHMVQPGYPLYVCAVSTRISTVNGISAVPRLN